MESDPAAAADASGEEKAPDDVQPEISPAENPEDGTLANTDGDPDDDSPKTGNEAGKNADGAAGDGEPEEGAEGKPIKKKKSEPRILVPFSSEEVDEIIKSAFTIISKEIESEEYDNGKVEGWKTIFEDYLIEKLNASAQPFKFTTYVAISQNTGDAMDIAFGGFYQVDFDGSVTSHWENEDVMIDVIVMAFSVQ